MTTVYLTEKPSQGNDLARVLGVKSKKVGYIEVAGGDVVTWSFGHMLELLEPQEYNAAWGKHWSWEQLPMVPEPFRLKTERGRAQQLKLVCNLLRKAARCVIATDAGREGELIAREILDYARFKGRVERLWTSALTDKALRDALAALRPGAQTEPLNEAAVARRESDWLWGLNLSRAVTLRMGVRGEAFPVGRVQTPTLALVVRRELEIRNFKPMEYFELDAMVTKADGTTFRMKHAPDEAHRIRSREEAERRKSVAETYSGPLSVTTRSAHEAPPLPFNLPGLQRVCSKVLGLSGKATLGIAQALYEKKAITYPRTDCEYLSESQKDEVPAILATLETDYAHAVKHVRTMGVTLRSTTFDDAQLTDHHGIIPTTQHVVLSGQEKEVFRLIAERLLQTLSPDYRFLETKALLDANGVLFTAKGRQPQLLGWRSVKLD